MIGFRIVFCSILLIASLAAGCSRHEAATDCDIERGPCLKKAGETISVSFDITPRPVKAMSERFYRVVLRKGDTPLTDAAITLSLSMPGMDMAPNTTYLYHKGEGVYEGACVIVRCPSGGNVWRADVVAERPGEERIRESFTFKVEL